MPCTDVSETLEYDPTSLASPAVTIEIEVKGPKQTSFLKRCKGEF